MTAVLVGRHVAHSGSGTHSGPRATCSAGCKPWPIAIDANAHLKACQCWHPFGVVLHGGHCCMREPIVCHAIPERYREPDHCATCGYPADRTELCGLCGTPMRGAAC